jgi:hypothetical protein
MHLSVVWGALKGSKLFQAGALLILFSGLAEACDQLGAVDLSSVPYVGNYSPAILATVGVAKVVFRLIAYFLAARKATEASA